MISMLVAEPLPIRRVRESLDEELDQPILDGVPTPAAGADDDAVRPVGTRTRLEHFPPERMETTTGADNHVQQVEAHGRRW